MKKHQLLSFLLTIMLVLHIGGALAETNYSNKIEASLFVSFDGDESSDEFAIDIASDGQLLYILTNQSLCIYDAAQGTLNRLLSNDGIDLLVSSEEGAFCLKLSSGVLSRIEGGMLVNYLSFDASPLDDLTVYNSFVCGNRVYFLTYSSETNASGLLFYDIPSREWNSSDDHNYVFISPYKDNKMIALLEDDDSFSLCELDADFMQTTLRREFDHANIGNLSYDKQSDCVFYVDNYELMQFPPRGQPTSVGVMPFEYFHDQSSKAFALANGQFAIKTFQGIFIRNWSNEVGVGEPLRVAIKDQKIVSGYNIAYTDRQVINTSISSEQLIQEILTKSKDYDIWEIDIALGLRLIDLGYAKDLSGSTFLTEDVRDMYEPIRDLVGTQDNFFAVPSQIDFLLWQHNTDMWSKYIGSELPRTMSELLSQYEDYYNSFDSDDEVCFFSEKEYLREFLLSQVITSYIYQTYQQEGPVLFNSQELLDICTRINELPIESGSSDDPDSTPQLIIISTDNIWSDETGESFRIMPIPSISNELSPVIPFKLHVYVINQNTKHFEEAVEFLEYAVQQRPITCNYALKPSLMEPVEKKRYQFDSKEEGSSAEWIISVENLQRYRDLARLLKYPNTARYLLTDTANEAFFSVYSRYFNGQIDTKQLLDELSNRSKMIYDESI